jgi:hypothetical protein
MEVVYLWPPLADGGVSPQVAGLFLKSKKRSYAMRHSKTHGKPLLVIRQGC